MIKYIGSKRRLVPVLGDLASRANAKTALDMFTGTTRVAQEFKQRGAEVWAVDKARYSEVFSQCYIEADALEVDKDALREALGDLNGMDGYDGYFTETFCRRSRYFQPFNGRRIDGIRDALDTQFSDSPLYPVLLTSLIEAADRVDSSTGVHMAYLKDWAPRAYKPLQLRMPALIPNRGHTVRADATMVASTLPSFDFAYLDPPYNQHSYFGNYHVWETLVAWDSPEVYGIACKRVDCKEPSNKSTFNFRRSMKQALANVINDLSARVMVLSYNNEAWVSLEELVEMCSSRGVVETLAFDSKRYVGAQIGIHNPSGEKVGTVSQLRNLEYVVISGAREDVENLTQPGKASNRSTLF